MKLLWMFLYILLLGITYGKHKSSHKKHAKKSYLKRSELPKSSPVKPMPALNDEPTTNAESLSKFSTKDNEEDLPGSYGEDDNVVNDFDGTVTSNKRNKKTKLKAENTENFGNNVKTKPGINPSLAFVVKEQNHLGFKGRDKSVNHKRSKKKSTQKIGAKQEKNGGIQKSTQKVDHDIVKDIKEIAKEIDVIEKKKKKEQKKLKNKESTKGAVVDNENEDLSTKNSHGISGDNNKGLIVNNTKDIDSFECPWSCFWSCHSYCPQECCNNPYNCSLTCREICSPYCKDRCCAPGSRRLPKLSLPFFSPSPKSKPNSNSVAKSLLKQQPAAELTLSRDRSFAAPTSVHFDPEIAFKIRKLKEQSDYAARLLSFNKCPSLCLKICTPIVCRRDCCSRPTQLFTTTQQQQQQQPSFRLPGIDDKTIQTVNFLQNGLAGTHNTPPVFYCRSPRNCPPGGIVDPNFCPPICRSSCIEQCPNECCPNFGQKGHTAIGK